MNEHIQWMVNRRSIRRYRPDPVLPNLIEQLLTAATWAPSAHNRQPWRFAVIESADHKHRLATSMGQKLRHDLRLDGLSAELIEKDAKRSYERITGAPLLILLCLSLVDMDDYPDDVRRRREEVMAVQSVAMAGQNLLLAAQALGLGACWMCAPLFCPEEVTQALCLPADWQPQGLVTLGYPAETRTKTRVPLETVVCYLG